MSTAAARNHRENCFDFLRLFAATTVVFVHMVRHLPWPAHWPRWGTDAHALQRILFYDGVPLFFILSGYLVYQSYERCVQRKRPSRQYFMNRLLRVAPAIYVYALITTVVVLVFGAAILTTAQDKKWFAIWFTSNFILFPLSATPSVFPHFQGATPNGSLWTIPSEFSFYLIVPLFYAVERRFGVKAMIVAVVVATVVAIVGIQQITEWVANSHRSPYITGVISMTFAPYLILFGWGMIWSRLWDRAPHSWMLALLAVVGYYLIRMYNVVGLENNHVSLDKDIVNHPVIALVWTLALSYAALWIGTYGPRIFSRITDRLGDLSYGVYVWHMVVVNMMLFFAVPKLLTAFPLLSYVIVLTGTFSLAALSWRFVEKPALRLKPYTMRVAENAAPNPDVAPPAPAVAEGSTLAAERSAP